MPCCSPVAFENRILHTWQPRAQTARGAFWTGRLKSPRATASFTDRRSGAQMRTFVHVVAIAALSLSARAQPGIPENARADGSRRGWSCQTGHVERERKCIALGAASDAEVRSYLVAQSIMNYSGSCPCPENLDRAGRRCGRRSAYSRPGGAAPMCYPADVPQSAVQEAKRRFPGKSRS